MRAKPRLARGPQQVGREWTRVALILGCFDRAGRVLRLDQVAARAGLPRSSVHRILTQLHAAGLLQHRSDGYCLGASSLAGAGTGDHSALRAAAAPVLDRSGSDVTVTGTVGVTSRPISPSRSRLRRVWVSILGLTPAIRRETSE